MKPYRLVVTPSNKNTFIALEGFENKTWKTEKLYACQSKELIRKIAGYGKKLNFIEKVEEWNESNV